MSRYLTALLARAAGDAGQVRLRPKFRFEGDRGGLSLDEQPLPPELKASRGDEAPPPSPTQTMAVAPRAGETENLSPNQLAPAGPALPTAAQAIHRDILLERIETVQQGERLVERHDRVVEHRLERVERVESRVDRAMPSIPGVIPPTASSQGSPPNVVIATAAAPSVPTPAATQPRRAPPTLPAAPLSPARVKSDPSPKIEPEITVSIGRLDIRLVPANETIHRAPKQMPRSAAESTMPLTEYLLRRERSVS
jgi:hypothetical protein